MKAKRLGLAGKNRKRFLKLLPEGGDIIYEILDTEDATGEIFCRDARMGSSEPCESIHITKFKKMLKSGEIQLLT